MFATCFADSRALRRSRPAAPPSDFEWVNIKLGASCFCGKINVHPHKPAAAPLNKISAYQRKSAVNFLFHACSFALIRG
jgi:hypothetical protein